jgi:predicted alpha-1,2-mannosidase
MTMSRRLMASIAAITTVLMLPVLIPPAPAAAADPPLVTDPVRYVDPFVGSSRGGNTWPGATRPFGMIAWSPTSTTGDQTSTGAANGYEYGATRVRGFSLTHVNGAGCNPGAAGDVPIMPFVGDVTTSPSADTTDARYASNFSHTTESASPGRYTVTLANGVRTDLAVSTRAGVGEFTYPAGSAAKLLFRTSNSLNGSEDAQISIDAPNRTVTGSVLTGAFCGRRANGGTNNRRTYYRLYFSATFDHAISATGTWRDGGVSPGGTNTTGGEGYATGSARAGRGSGGWVAFSTGTDADVRMRIGISYVSLAGAAANRDAELPVPATTASTAAATRDAWNTELQRVLVGGGTEARRSAFYTAIYHSLLQPQTVSDVDGRYVGPDMAVHLVVPGQQAQYGTFSGWDQYRAQIQLLALLRPDVAGELAQSMLAYAQQSGGVWDRWLHLGAATHVMTGDPAAPTLATFHAMGVRNFDVGAAYDSLMRQALVQNPQALNTAGCPGQCTGQRPALTTYIAKRYAPNDTCACWGGAAETLENSLADFSLAMWSNRLGRNTSGLLARSTWWRNTFNPANGGYQQARTANGAWVSGFTPSTETGFAQGSSATYTWMVPQDVTGLGALMGGAGTAAARLDVFFQTVTGGNALRYDPTNEPGIHIPWMYNGLGRPWKTQATVRRIVDTVYGTGPAGLPGNDDLGTMSSWYAFAAIGMFPQVPGRAEMLLGSPVFPRVVIARSNGVTLTVTANTTDTYIRAVTLDGAVRTQSWLPESFVQNGGAVSFTLGTTADTAWGTGPADLPIDRVPR